PQGVRAPLTSWEYAKDSDDPIFSDEETALFENSSAFWYSPLAVSMIERVVWGYWVSFAYFRDVSDQLVLVFRQACSLRLTNSASPLNATMEPTRALPLEYSLPCLA